MALLDPFLLRGHDLVAVADAELAPLRRLHGLSRPAPDDIARRDAAADDLILGARLWSGFEGASLSAGGLLSMMPNLVAFLRTQLRLVQSLALLYDEPPATREEKLAVWRLIGQGAGGGGVESLAASGGAVSAPFATSAAGLVARALLKRLGLSATPALLSRLVPMVGALSAGLSSAQVASRVGELAKQYYRERHLARTERARRILEKGPQLPKRQPPDAGD